MTHTFHATFGEITITLENVAVATLFPLTSDIDPVNCGNSLTVEEQQVRTTLFIIHNSLLPTKHWKIMKSTSLLGVLILMSIRRSTSVFVGRLLCSFG